MHKDGSQTLSRVGIDEVGRMITTKAILSGKGEDVTSNYKFAEGTVAERATMLGE